MNRISIFLFGVIVGSALMFTSLKCHVVRAGDGWHMIPKVTGELGDTYVDIREFNAEKWSQHKALALAIAKADKSELMQESVAGSLQRSVKDAFQSFKKEKESGL